MYGTLLSLQGSCRLAANSKVVCETLSLSGLCWVKAAGADHCHSGHVAVPGCWNAHHLEKLKNVQGRTWPQLVAQPMPVPHYIGKLQQMYAKVLKFSTFTNSARGEIPVGRGLQRCASVH